MIYKVLKTFADLQDNKHLYGPGDLFPRPGVSVSDERIKELSSNNNLMREILIEKVEENDPDGDMPIPKKLVRQKSEKVDRKNKHKQ